MTCMLQSAGAHALVIGPLVMSSTRASGGGGAPRDMACTGVPSSGARPACQPCPARSAALVADTSCSAASTAAPAQRGRSW